MVYAQNLLYTLSESHLRHEHNRRYIDLKTSMPFQNLIYPTELGTALTQYIGPCSTRTKAADHRPLNGVASKSRQENTYDKVYVRMKPAG